MDKLAFVALASVKEQAKVRASITNSMANASTVAVSYTHLRAHET